MKNILVFSAIFFTAANAWAGSVSGKVSFNGTPPAPSKLDTGADPTCAAHSPQGVPNEELLVTNGGLQNVFIYVKEGLPAGQTYPAPAVKAVLDQKGCRYVPHVLGLRTGQELEVLNSDPTLHNVHGLPKASKEFNLGMPIQGMKLKRKFDKAEVMVKFKCDVHPWMSAYVGVLDHPFFSVSAADGAFEIKDLPAGTYTLEAWHEKLGTQTAQVTVGDGAAAEDFTFAG